ncbi:putative PPPDE putative peptidase domain containing protein [Blattamonas nauphoetae]|uniref:PPPDE putative peptidase domain containing protein n=1 Tax=Blattamonas nauphoetae TaxID=2049346 RepID=A0ABQ9XJE2_9EUKA|nr:putative PPPDE putative peptidase domain containing protein [Blattamonas nauphoetae]
MTSRVRVVVYDIAHKFPQIARNYLSKHNFPYVFHTEIQAFGCTYLFANGIIRYEHQYQTCLVRLNIHNLGTTDKTQETFEQWLRTRIADYAPEKYHILKWNCTDFANDVSLYLTGQPIPQYIYSQSKLLRGSFMGQLSRPIFSLIYSKGYRGDGHEGVLFPEHLRHP